MVRRALLILLILAPSPALADVLPDWHEGFAAPPSGLGLDGDARALLRHDDGLWCGGSFLHAGDVSCGFIARLDDEHGNLSWTHVGDLDGRVDALVAWGDSVLAGGRFTSADGVAVNRVAVHDGNAWHPVGDPAAWSWGHVLALTLHAGRPWAAGTDFVVRWDGSTWIPATGPDFGGEIFALASHDEGVVAAGAFTTITDPFGSSTPAANIARWDGVWSALGNGLGGTCYALAVWLDELVAGGVFVAPAPLLASWNGSGWSALGSGVNGRFVTALASRGLRLAVGGDLDGAGGSPVSDVALYDGASWNGMTGGVAGMVRTIASGPGDLALGGAFTTVRGGDLESAHVGIWIDPTVGVPPHARPTFSLEAHPNPFNPATTVRCELGADVPVRLEIFDPVGRRAKTLAISTLHAGAHLFTWDGRDDAGRLLPSGLYLVRLRTPGGDASLRISLLR